MMRMVVVTVHGGSRALEPMAILVIRIRRGRSSPRNRTPGVRRGRVGVGLTLLFEDFSEELLCSAFLADFVAKIPQVHTGSLDRDVEAVAYIGNGPVLRDAGSGRRQRRRVRDNGHGARSRSQEIILVRGGRQEARGARRVWSRMPDF